MDDNSQQWILNALNSCVTVDNVLEISSLFCDIDELLTTSDEIDLLDPRVVPALRISTRNTRAELRRLECSLFGI